MLPTTLGTRSKLKLTGRMAGSVNRNLRPRLAPPQANSWARERLGNQDPTSEQLRSQLDQMVGKPTRRDAGWNLD